VTALGKPFIDEAAELEQDDFLAFWRTRQAETAPETKRILGVDVVVPTDIPLRLEIMAAEMANAQNADDLRPLLVDIFGADHFDAWIAHGLTVRMMKVILAWGVANGSGTPCTFERAMELAEQMEVDAAGKARPVPNRADRRASSGTGKSASTGTSSSRTSAASTTSRRRKSAS
jgi:hypothetical protein